MVSVDLPVLPPAPAYPFSKVDQMLTLLLTVSVEIQKKGPPEMSMFQSLRPANVFSHMAKEIREYIRDRGLG